MSVQRDLTSQTATSPRLRLGSRVTATPAAIRTLAAAHPDTPLRELVPVVSEASITLRVAPGWLAISTLAPDADGAPFVALVGFEPESGPPRRVPATVKRRAVGDKALIVARECFNNLDEQGGAAAIERYGYDVSLATSPLVHRTGDREYALVASTLSDVVATGSRRSLMDTAERLGLTREQIRNQVQKARDRGILDGDKLTERGGRALREH